MVGDEDPRERAEDWALGRDHRRAWEEQAEGLVPRSLRGAWSLQTLSQGPGEGGDSHA